MRRGQWGGVRGTIQGRGGGQPPPSPPAVGQAAEGKGKEIEHVCLPTPHPSPHPPWEKVGSWPSGRIWGWDLPSLLPLLENEDYESTSSKGISEDHTGWSVGSTE